MVSSATVFGLWKDFYLLSQPLTTLTLTPLVYALLGSVHIIRAILEWLRRREMF